MLIENNEFTRKHQELSDFKLNPREGKLIINKPDDLVEDAHEQLMVDSQFHNDIQHGLENYREHQMIVENAENIMKGLRNKALEKAEGQIKDKKVQALAKYFVQESKKREGSKIDYLV